MSKLLILLTFMLFSCSEYDTLEVFKIDSYSNFEFIDFSKIDNIEAFNIDFWKADSANDKFSFIAKYNFEIGRFSNSSNYGIKLEGLPYNCLIYDCSNRNRLKFYFSENYEILNNELEVLEAEEIKELITQNILNYGKNPELSDSPKVAVTELFLKLDQNISKISPTLKIISDCYLDLIESKKLETGLPINELVSEFPLVIHLRRKMFSADLTPTIQSEEIEEDIEIDFQD